MESEWREGRSVVAKLDVLRLEKEEVATGLKDSP